MKHIIAITTLVLTTGCAIFQTDPVAKKEAEILKLMATIRPDLKRQVGEPWFTFSHQQHEEHTLAALLNLSKTASDENVRRWAIDSLSHQNNPRRIPFWEEILDNRDAVDKRSVYAAISGLGTIHVPEASDILLALLSEPETPPELLVHLCVTYQNRYIPQEVLDQLVVLTAHTSEQVRVAAFEAVPYHSEHTSLTETLRNQLLERALYDPSSKIVRWGLYSLGENPLAEHFPMILEHLNHADLSVRVRADRVLYNSYLNSAEQFEICRKALEEKRWSYQTAPQLTLRYAQILEAGKGELAEAEQAYRTARRAYDSNDANWSNNFNPGATMLYRLIQVKQKRGDIEGAIAVLNQLVTEYLEHTRVDAHDFPTPGENMIIKSVGELAPELRTILVDAPIRIHVSPLNRGDQPRHRLKFKVGVHNITTENVTLYHQHWTDDDVLIPNPPIVTVNGKTWTRLHFDDTTASTNTVKEVTIPPNELFELIGTLYLNRTGDYVIDFRFKPVCEFEDGRQWSAWILANSVKITIP